MGGRGRGRASALFVFQTPAKPIACFRPPTQKGLPESQVLSSQQNPHPLSNPSSVTTDNRFSVFFPVNILKASGALPHPTIYGRGSRRAPVAWGALSTSEPAPRGQAGRLSRRFSTCWGARRTHAPVYGTENSLGSANALLVGTRLQGKPSLISCYAFCCYCISHTASKQAPQMVRGQARVCECGGGQTPSPTSSRCCGFSAACVDKLCSGEQPGAANDHGRHRGALGSHPQPPSAPGPVPFGATSHGHPWGRWWLRRGRVLDSGRGAGEPSPG